jgi:hypothetical protein
MRGLVDAVGTRIKTENRPTDDLPLSGSGLTPT